MKTSLTASQCFTLQEVSCWWLCKISNLNHPKYSGKVGEALCKSEIGGSPLAEPNSYQNNTILKCTRKPETLLLCFPPFITAGHNLETSILEKSSPRMESQKQSTRASKFHRSLLLGPCLHTHNVTPYSKACNFLAPRLHVVEDQIPKDQEPCLLTSLATVLQVLQV